jgi:heme/copper-type cytochrome/quinol oxidase subunit 1
LYYLINALLFTLSGTLYSLILRLELYGSGNRIIHSENLNSYNLSVTLHGLIMIFFVIMPVLYGGLANYLLPIYILSPEVSFPRINCLSLLILPFSYSYLLISLCTEFGAATGWTFYPPLSTSLMSLSAVGVDLLIMGLLLSGISSFMTSLNFFCTVINMRGYGLTSYSLSLYTFAVLITAVLLLLSLPVLTGALFMIFSDLHFNTIFFDATFYGDPILYQHLFWFFGHPEVYILIIPAFGVISQTISTSVSSLLFALQTKILAKVCISFLGTIVWSHHLYTINLEMDTKAYFSTITMLISLPTGTKIFNWLTTFYFNNIGLTFTHMFYSFVFLLMFTIGGLTGILLANASIDISLHDTYYVVAHFHYVLSLGAVIALFVCLLFYSTLLLGYNTFLHMINSTLLYYNFYFIILGINITFTPLHFLGFNSMPRRIPDYPDLIMNWNFLSSCGSSLTLLGFLFIYVCWVS